MTPPSNLPLYPYPTSIFEIKRNKLPPIPGLPVLNTVLSERDLNLNKRG